MPEVPIEMRKISPKRRIEMQLIRSALGKYLAEVSGGRQNDLWLCDRGAREIDHCSRYPGSVRSVHSSVHKLPVTSSNDRADRTVRFWTRKLGDDRRGSEISLRQYRA